MKRSKVKLLFLLLLIAQFATAVKAQYQTYPGGNAGILIGYLPQSQQESQWCWAASGSMVMTYVSSSNAPSQCEEANDRFGGDCCDNPSSSTCNEPGWPNLAHYGYSSSTTSSGTALTFAQIKSILEANSPICFSWRWTGGGGHMMTVDGWCDNGTKYVYVVDPWPVGEGAAGWKTYSSYVSGSNYTHGSDIYNITR